MGSLYHDIGRQELLDNFNFLIQNACFLNKKLLSLLQN
jgi:hypothetical protein